MATSPCADPTQPNLRSTLLPGAAAAAAAATAEPHSPAGRAAEMAWRWREEPAGVELRGAVSESAARPPPPDGWRRPRLASAGDSTP